MKRRSFITLLGGSALSAIRRAQRRRGGARPSRPSHSGDIPATACALGIALTDHATVLARAKHAVAKIEAGMAWAQRTGALHEFNQEYRRRRLKRKGEARGSWVTHRRRRGCGARSPR